MNLVDPSYELIDPNPDLHASFIQFNEVFFYGALAGCEVSWSNRMTQCAGLCSFQPRSGYCSIRLSVPLLKLRPRKDFVETLLHEMIHAYLFLTSGNQDRDGHGPTFQAHMHRINNIAGTRITIYHSFHAEVAVYKQHWWRCEGRCRSVAPFYGWVKRTMNRAPSKNDTWWAQHEQTCGGKFIKVKEPDPKPNAKKRKAIEPGTPKIDSIFNGTGYRLGDGTENTVNVQETDKKASPSKKAKVKEPTTPKSKSFPGKGYRLGDGSESATKKKGGGRKPKVEKPSSTQTTLNFPGQGYVKAEDKKENEIKKPPEIITLSPDFKLSFPTSGSRVVSGGNTLNEIITIDD